MKKITNDFQVFMEESHGVGQALMKVITTSSEGSALDSKTQELAYISVLAALQLSAGLPFHVAHAKELGASLEEVKSAVLVGLPLVGIRITEAFAKAIESYEEI